MLEKVGDYEFYVGHVSEQEAKQELVKDFMVPIPMLMRVMKRAEVPLKEVRLAHVLWFYDQTVMTQKG